MTPLRYPLHPDSAAHPDPPYRRIRESEPIQRVLLPSNDPAVMVTRYEDVRTVLSDPRFSVRLDYEGAPRLFDSTATLTAGTLMGMDPPEHTRLRRLVAKAFTARRIEAQRPGVRRQDRKSVV